jgi:hypothetical protein
MFACGACKKPIQGTESEPVVVVSDGILTSDGEMEFQNVETFHATCVTIDY